MLLLCFFSSRRRHTRCALVTGVQTCALPSPPRRDSGYRDYSEADIHRLQFIANARDLGFPIEEIRVLLDLWSDRDRASAEVKALAESRAADLGRSEEHTSELQSLMRISYAVFCLKKKKTIT